jgi:hypothetical protein
LLDPVHNSGTQTWTITQKTQAKSMSSRRERKSRRSDQQSPGNSAFLKVSAAIADPFKGTERRRSAHCCAESPEKLPKSVRDVLGPAPSRSIASCGMKKPGPKCVPIQMQSDCDLHCGPPKTERECASVRRPSFIANDNRSNNVAGLDPALSRPR